jgi:YMGG-like Gly-zipper
MKAWPGIILVLMTLSLITGCASSPYLGTGALVGGGAGTLLGAAIGHRNPWQGALIGGLVGTGLGAGTGYLIQRRQASQPPQGYYQSAPPGYGAPPPGYGYNAPAPGPGYGYNAPGPAAPPGPRYSDNAPSPPSGPGMGWNTPAPVTPSGPGYGGNSGPPAYSRTPDPSSVHRPIINAPYNNYQ